MRLLFLLLAFPFIAIGQNHQQFQFDGPAILIHGGAGGIERKYYTDGHWEVVGLDTSGLF